MLARPGIPHFFDLARQRQVWLPWVRFSGNLAMLTLKSEAILAGGEDYCLWLGGMKR